MAETPNSLIDSVQIVDDPYANRMSPETEEIEKDPVNPPPPSYYLDFVTPDAMEPPNLALFADKNYFLLFE